MMFDWVAFWKMFLVIFGVVCAFTFALIAVAYDSAWWLLGSLLGIVSISVSAGLEGW